MLIYNLINNSTKKNGKKSLQTFAHIKKKSYLCIDFEKQSN